MKKIGILGGTFDPFHKGHLMMATESMQALELDKVLIQPNKIPYYREKPIATDEERLNICKLATQEISDIEVSSLEIDSPTYLSTFDVLSIMRQKYPNDCLIFIIGMDSFLYLDKWKHSSELLDIGSIAVIKRPGYVIETATMSLELKKIYEKRQNRNIPEKPFGELFFIDNTEVPISATELRKCLKDKDYNSAKKFIAPLALQYIQKNHIY